MVGCWLYQWPLWSLWSRKILAIFICSFFSVFPERAQHRGEQSKIIRNRLVPCPRYRGYREGAICGRFWHLSLLSTAILGDQLINSAGEQLISLLYLHLVESSWSIFSSRHRPVLITWFAIVCQMTLNFIEPNTWCCRLLCLPAWRGYQNKKRKNSQHPAQKYIARIAKVALHKCPGSVCPICLFYPLWPVWPVRGIFGCQMSSRMTYLKGLNDRIC